MIGPPVQVAKNMRDFEKDESLFDFGNLKSGKQNKEKSENADAQTSTNQESSSVEKKNTKKFEVSRGQTKQINNQKEVDIKL